jgi:hypothetical protein
MKKINMLALIIALVMDYIFLGFFHYLIKVPGTPFSFNPSIMFGDFIFGLEFLLSISFAKWLGFVVLIWWSFFIYKKADYFLTRGSAS